ncbi:MAG: hypothetical protein QOI01_1396 [Mycobacterium sp.]|jgi:hypothetical protein|nr:hypothetical protein [Mycobacterium sp.]
MTQFRLERGEGGVACRCGLATATGVDAQLASIDAATAARRHQLARADDQERR